MSDETKRPEKGQVLVLSSTQPADRPPTLRTAEERSATAVRDIHARPDIRDPAFMREWLAQLRDTALDGLAAGEDATRKRQDRFFSRVEARRRIEEATQNLQQMIEAIESRLPGNDA